MRERLTPPRLPSARAARVERAANADPVSCSEPRRCPLGNGRRPTGSLVAGKRAPTDTVMKRSCHPSTQSTPLGVCWCAAHARLCCTAHPSGTTQGEPARVAVEHAAACRPGRRRPLAGAHHTGRGLDPWSSSAAASAARRPRRLRTVAAHLGAVAWIDTFSGCAPVITRSRSASVEAGER